LVDVARLLRGTLVWLSGAAHLAVLRPVRGQSPVLLDVACLRHGTPVWLSRAADGTLVHTASATAVATLDIMVRGVGPAISHRLPQLDGIRSPTPVTDWVADSCATNHTTPHPGHIMSHMPPSLAHPSSIVVGNSSILPVTSVGGSVLPGPFYLNDVLVAPDLV
jgi:hypothetical protein